MQNLIGLWCSSRKTTNRHWLFFFFLIQQQRRKCFVLLVYGNGFTARITSPYLPRMQLGLAVLYQAWLILCVYDMLVCCFTRIRKHSLQDTLCIAPSCITKPSPPTFSLSCFSLFCLCFFFSLCLFSPVTLHICRRSKRRKTRTQQPGNTAHPTSSEIYTKARPFCFLIMLIKV